MAEPVPGRVTALAQWPGEKQRAGVLAAPRVGRSDSGALRLDSVISYASIHQWDNLLVAARKACQGKRGKASTAAFDYDLEEALFQLQTELATETYRPGGYRSFHIHDPKRRLISAAPFRDRVVHHALCNQLEPVFDRGFIADSFANRTGKGTHRALNRVQQFSRRFRYALACDVRQFFPSIDHAILRSILFRKIPDPKTRRLIERILASGIGVLSEAYDMVWFPRDDLLAAARPRGLPIGNLTSQIWANCYLSPFDHFVKRELRCPGYIRYVDDFVLFANDKKTLWNWLAGIEARLAKLRLVIHSGSHPRPVSEGVPFLGFIVFPKRRRLKRRNAVNFGRRIRRILEDLDEGAITRENLNDSVAGWLAHASHGNTVGLQKSVLETLGLNRDDFQ